jgi:Golgi nucleoside diphosphatase
MKTPALTSFLTNPSAAGPSLQPMLDFVKGKLPDQDLAKVPVYVRATAGLRIAFEDQPSETSAMLDAVRDYLSKSGYLFQRDWVSILPGEAEGMYGWIAINFLSNHPFDLPLAAADMGGASTQMTFEPSDGTVQLENAIDVQLGPESKGKTLYTHSYLAYGQDQALLRYQEGLVIANRVNSSVLSAPCFWREYTGLFSYNGSDYTLVGTGDIQMCAEELRAYVLDIDGFCPSAPCAMNSVYQPDLPSDTLLFLFAGYSYTASFYNCSGYQNVTCLHDAAVPLIESLTWSELQARFPAVTPTYLLNYGFTALYFNAVLRVGYRLQDSQEVWFGDQINGNTVSWALGAMMSEVRALHPVLPPSNAPDVDFQWGIEILCNSMGSTLSVYSWPTRTSPSEMPQVRCAPYDGSEDCWVFSTMGGIDTMTDNGPGLAAMMQAMLAYAKTKVPPNLWSDTPLHLSATGAMRLLEISNPDGAALVMTVIRSALESGPFAFASSYAAVLAGEEESAFGWVAVNFVNKALTRQPVALHQTGPVFSLGANSLEVSLVPSEPPLAGYFPFSVAAQPVPLYAASYLTYGQETAMARYTAAFVSDFVPGPRAFPCLWRGLNRTYEDAQGNSYQLLGTGDWLACRQSLPALSLDLGGFCAASPCAMNGVYSPALPASQTLYVTTGVSAALAFFDCAGAGQLQTTFQCLYDAAALACETLTFAQANLPVTNTHANTHLPCFLFPSFSHKDNSFRLKSCIRHWPLRWLRTHAGWPRMWTPSLMPWPSTARARLWLLKNFRARSQTSHWEPCWCMLARWAGDLRSPRGTWC